MNFVRRFLVTFPEMRPEARLLRLRTKARRVDTCSAARTSRVPLLVDELVRQCHASTAEVQRALLELELDGRLERHPGNRVSLASF
jgi:predicted Rossmann fold nucleotide-binding protein DprA/Smf involved in DNA uptake